MAIQIKKYWVLKYYYYYYYYYYYLYYCCRYAYISCQFELSNAFKDAIKEAKTG